MKEDNILRDIGDESIVETFTKHEMERPSPRKFVKAVDDAQSMPRDVLANPRLLVWDLIEGKHLFYRHDPDGKGYSTHAHLAEVMGILGPPPSDLIKRRVRSHQFFTEDSESSHNLRELSPDQTQSDQWKAEVEIPQSTSLEKSEEYLDGENKEMFLRFMREMLQWRPEHRKTASELLGDPWLNS
ncbi:uncharacterized protein PAC_01167 [Phialocephala subalpina]|uniref:Protein kinase domain-containing protein n=1 Tax=Phialocephala subalpina TaxID=576137 RepID=A0A1L7WET1_9HELO|nr:uncharacterized protein PAC_01167 [Phialocephala subalpina]